MTAPRLDCLIIGGGPAGMTAALYLARFGRRFALFDAGDSRAAWIPESHTLPLYADGMNGKRMLAMMRGHLARYGVSATAGEVTRLEREEELFVARLQRPDGGVENWRAPMILLATGALDCPPSMPALEEAVSRGLVRYCPICDGYEARGRTVAVLGQGRHGLAEALFLARSFGARVSLLAIGEPLRLAPDDCRHASEAGVTLIDTPVTGLDIHGDGLSCLCSGGEGCHRFDTAYVALGLDVRSDLAVALGARHDDNRALIIDAHAETSVPGLFAAGDVATGLNQILIAMGHAAAAATAMHNRCEGPSAWDGEQPGALQPRTNGR